MKNNQPSILIAGAGPVGLVAANIFADAGISVAIFEAEAELPTTLRASTFQPSTLDYLDRFGISEKLIDQGLVAPRMQYRDRHGWMVELDFGSISQDTHHPYRVQCEQYKLTKLLADRLQQFAHANIHFSTQVNAVNQSSDGVSVTLKSPQGDTVINGDWLIGADGGRSQVREALGIKLGGFTWPERFLVASTPFDFPSVIPNLCEVSYFADPQEWFFLLYVSGLWRVMIPIDINENDSDALSDASIQKRLQRVFQKTGDYEIRHRTIYNVHQRVADRYRDGRAFIAGDAAHLNNPLGGMGMNGGIHDAFTLADLLVQVQQGQIPVSQLDLYEQKRRPIALEYVNTITIANKRNLETKDPQEQKIWREQMTKIASDQILARDYLLKVSMIASLRKQEQGMYAV
jgi:3-(3-hydroxy-phenyl)propionate hydroxylase